MTTKNIIYFSNGIESITKRKHLLFLQKSGFVLTKVNDSILLNDKIKQLNPLVIILNDEQTLPDVIHLVNNTPIIVILRNQKNIGDVLSKVDNYESIIFFRNETDPIDSIHETIKLLEKVENGNKRKAL